MAKEVKSYELTIIADDSANQSQIDELTKMIRKHGKITAWEDEGIKRLAYPIRNHEKGHYLYYEMKLDGDEPGKLSSELNINDVSIRYLLVRTVNR